MEAESAGPVLHQAERQSSKKLRRDGEARNMPREERNMTAMMRHIEEMEQEEKAVKAGLCSKQLARFGYVHGRFDVRLQV